MSVFKFDYKSEEDLTPKTILLMPGEASFKIVGVFDKRKDGTPLTTMDGTPKLTVSLSVIDASGASGLVYDDVTSKMAWKVKALLDAVGLSNLYNSSGTFNPDDLVGCIGRCVIETRKSEGYADRSTVKKYIKKGGIKEAVTEPVDDIIPF